MGKGIVALLCVNRHKETPLDLPSAVSFLPIYYAALDYFLSHLIRTNRICKIVKRSNRTLNIFSSTCDLVVLILEIPSNVCFFSAKHHCQNQPGLGHGLCSPRMQKHFRLKSQVLCFIFFFFPNLK